MTRNDRLILHLQGAEMKNALFKDFCSKNGIAIIYPNTSHHAPHIGR